MFPIEIPAEPFGTKAPPIVTLDSPQQAVLRTVTTEITPSEWDLAKDIAFKLYLALKPHFPAAGLSAPQIGISKSIFIYSYDRDPKHLEVVVNPSYLSEGEETVIGWEGCLSSLTGETRCIARIPRYKKLLVTYFDLEGDRQQRLLEGFAARVFQHECDHLEGILNIEHPEASVKAFASQQELQAFMSEVKKGDSQQYIPPKRIAHLPPSSGGLTR